MSVLTIGIPTLNRPELLRQALDSALAQDSAHRVQIVVADQGGSAGTAAVRKQYRRARWIKSRAKSSWENWRTVALACETEYFAWLQDDDVLMPCFAERALGAFARHPSAAAYCGVLHGSLPGHARQLPWAGVWPLVPLDERTGAYRLVHGDLMVPVSYVDTFAMSPAVAFRSDADWRSLLESLPGDMEFFLERLFLVGAGRLGPIACDPTVVGCISQHSDRRGNELRNTPGEKDRQYRQLLRILDPIMARLAEPERWFTEGLGPAAGSFGDRWLADTAAFRNESYHLWRARQIILKITGRPADSPFPIQAAGA